MNTECPICNLLKGDGKNVDGTLCEDCRANQKLQAGFEGWRMLRTVRNAVMFYTWLWPVVLLLIMCLDVVRSDWTSLTGIVVAFLMWVFCVFWLYPKQGIDRAFWKPWAKMVAEREKMFISKVSGPEKQ